MANNLTGIHYLGCTYDIYGYYARGNSVNTAQRLFDLPEADAVITIQDREYSYPKDAIGTPVVLGFTRVVESFSESTEELHTKMSIDANLKGSYGLFSAEVSAKYSASYTSSSYFYHFEKSSYLHSYKLTLDLDYALNNLDQNFKNDVYNKTNGSTYDMTAKELVEKYGTHFLYEALFGGRLSYSQSFSKFSNSNRGELETKVRTNYANYSAKISGSHETYSSESNSDSNAEFWCIGGAPETLRQGYEAWSATVSGNFVLVDFTSDSLKRISELVVDDDVRKTEIDAAIQAVLDGVEEPSTTKLTTSTKSEDQEEWSKGDTSNLELDSGKSDDGRVVVGFAGKVNNSKGDFSRIAVCYLNMSTGERIWEVFGNVDTYNKEDYETIGEVPAGCVLTGIGLTGKDKDFSQMVLHYQELTPASSTYNYLDNNLQSIAFNRQNETDPDSGYESEFNPGSNNGKVITGIGVTYRNNGVKSVKLYRNILVETNN
ncbi:MAG: hypothetical protein F6K18_26455 [Okeania sp. SIO2C2]|uniref:MAC/perforin domain-containing protein n=1 Tax=Okeania sp. SIO2C2 TaxID=2607787 RepID=UPI0013B93891|nr:MAC/perforin domain-containing protein [Okeania sp. SIO2C2]NEP90080.1 hypothetical protein [Okeania sp. SIO2C2]